MKDQTVKGLLLGLGRWLEFYILSKDAVEMGSGDQEVGREGHPHVFAMFKIRSNSAHVTFPSPASSFFIRYEEEKF